MYLLFWASFTLPEKSAQASLKTQCLKIDQKCLISSFLKDQKLHNFPTSEKDVTEDIFFRCRKVTNTIE